MHVSNPGWIPDTFKKASTCLHSYALLSLDILPILVSCTHPCTADASLR